MELAEIRPFEPQMAEIDLFTMPDAVGVGEPSVRKKKPYIAGHVTDGSSSFTFTVNGNVSVTVPVDANGKWKWVVDRTITSLQDAFKDKTQLDNLTLEKCILDNCESYYNVVRNTKIVRFKLTDKQTRNVKDMTYAVYGISTLEELDLSECTFPKAINVAAMCYSIPNITKLDLHSATFENCGNATFLVADSNFEEVDLRNATFKSTCNVNYFARYANKLKTIILKSKGLFTSLSFPNSKLLTEQSVVNLFNAVAADGITLTFHATVYAMIQAQLDIEDSPIYNAYWNSEYDFTVISA